jgi:PHD/YefM family antitoxin component YafN of YafNO toxin-antitoxin module
MAAFSIREFARTASRVVEDVSRTKRRALVTQRGVLVAAVVPLDTERVENLVVPQHLGVLEDLAAGEADIAGGRTVSVRDALAELDDEDTRR